jgi:HEXXH motif-containing protein
VPLQPPVNLTVPKPGSSTTKRIVGAYLKRCLSDFLRIPIQRFDAAAADDFGRVRALVDGLARTGNAGLVFSLMRRVTISTLIRCIDAELWGRGDVTRLDAWLAELSGTVAFELAAAGALPESGLRLRKAPRRMGSPAHGVVAVPSNCVVEFGPGWLSFERGATKRVVAVGELHHADLSAFEGVSVTRPYHEIVPGLALALVDSNPLSAVEAHPDKEGNAIDLGTRSPADWVCALRDAYHLVAKHLPTLAEEIRLVMQLLVPVGYDAERHLSASYAEAIGVAYLSLHPDPMTMAEALIHEFSHNKLNALMRLDPVLENAHHPLFASPVRPDPRPLSGVLLAVHAFTPVAHLYELMTMAGDPRALNPSFARRYRQIIDGNHEAMMTLTAHARPTPVGTALLDELARWDAHFN